MDTMPPESDAPDETPPRGDRLVVAVEKMADTLEMGVGCLVAVAAVMVPAFFFSWLTR